MIHLPQAVGSLAVAAVAGGLAISPLLGTPDAGLLEAGGGLLLLAAAIVFVHSRGRQPEATPPSGSGHAMQGATLVLLPILLAVGALAGQARLAAIEAGAFRPSVEGEVIFNGYLESPPRRRSAHTRLHLNGPAGRVAVLAETIPDGLEVGIGLTVRGRTSPLPEWLRPFLRREGIVTTIEAKQIVTGPRRRGLHGFLDRIRSRAIQGMSDGMGEREAALAAGFVLGQDEAIDPITEEDFRRSGLAHLLAVSGQNVMLLILLASLPLALAGLGLRQRVPPLILLLLFYLGLTGAGPSIQRATVMGTVMLLMLWLGRPHQRLFALLTAVLLTLAANPRATGDVGWQLSFAATCAIMLLAPDVRKIFVSTDRSHALRRHLADATAVTLAATLATLPLIAHHFGTIPLGTVSANLLALPAVAPVMWLGMIAGALGQIPGFPTEAINLVNAALIAYIAHVARTISSLEGGVIEVSFGPGWLVALAELAVLFLGLLVVGALRRVRRSSPLLGRLSICLTVIAVVLPPAAALMPSSIAGDERGISGGLRIVALDVGQGDAILIQRKAHNLLIDTGPPGVPLSRKLARYGVDRLDAVFLTHPDLDHIGGLDELGRRTEIGKLISSAPLSVAGRPPSLSLVRAGDRITVGDLRFEVLWPLDTKRHPGADRNAVSLVMLLRWRGFRALFTGDAEAEQSGYEAGDIDLLKVAHHGSADSGLSRLLTRSDPEIAVISVGEENTYGHPATSTLATLRDHGVQTYRTDRGGDLVIDLNGHPDRPAD